MNIKFTYSQQHENNLQGEGRDFDVLATVSQMELLWYERGQDYLKAFEKVTGLQFEPAVTCYINSKKSYSDPLSLRVDELEVMWQNLMHELGGHRLLTYNFPKIKEKWEALMATLKDEVPLTKTHVVVHAIHELVLKELGLNDEIAAIRAYSTNKAYVRSWELVDEHGAENIVAYLKV